MLLPGPEVPGGSALFSPPLRVFLCVFHNDAHSFSFLVLFSGKNEGRIILFPPPKSSGHHGGIFGNQLRVYCED